MEIEEIRRYNVALIIKEKCDGNKAAFATKIDKSPSYVSRWFSKKEQKRNIDTTSARLIELKFGLPAGWMDKIQDKIREIMSEDHFRNQLIDFYDKLSHESKHKLVNMANTLLRDENEIDNTAASPFKKQKKEKQ